MDAAAGQGQQQNHTFAFPESAEAEERAAALRARLQRVVDSGESFLQRVADGGDGGARELLETCHRRLGYMEKVDPLLVVADAAQVAAGGYSFFLGEGLQAADMWTFGRWQGA